MGNVRETRDTMFSQVMQFVLQVQKLGASANTLIKHDRKRVGPLSGAHWQIDTSKLGDLASAANAARCLDRERGGRNVLRTQNNRGDWLWSSKLLTTQPLRQEGLRRP